MTGKTKLLRANFETERSIAFGALTDAFQAMGVAFAHPIRELRLYNQTDVVIQYSIDGTDVHASLAAGEAWNINAMSLKQSDIGCYFRDGLFVYARHITGSAPSSGSARANLVYAE
jgi:hypothetical protein